MNNNWDNTRILRPIQSIAQYSQYARLARSREYLWHPPKVVI